MHPDDAARFGLGEGDWARVESRHGAIVAKVAIHPTMRAGHLRIPHGWWFPEIEPDPGLSGAFLCNDGVLIADDPEYLDAEQGAPHFKGFPGRITKLDRTPDLRDRGPAAVIDRWLAELRHRRAEAHARTMVRVVNRTFKRQPGRVDRIAHRLVTKAAGPRQNEAAGAPASGGDGRRRTCSSR